MVAVLPFVRVLRRGAAAILTASCDCPVPSCPRLRDDPAEAEISSHRLLLRAGFVRQLAAGFYSYLRNAIRVMRTIEDLVREEMEAAGSIEVRVPIVLPTEPWKATGRWDAYGDLVFKIQDLHEREMMLGPTHEEVFAPLVAGDLPSYRDLPINLFQVEWKYRDERRPRYGLLRTREFLMKDAYSFDRDEDGMRESYRIMYEAYERIFERLGLDLVVVEADPGTIGGDVNHEFMALAQVGEDLFVRCVNGDYLADTEAATPQAPAPLVDPELEPMVEVETPGAADDRSGRDSARHRALAHAEEHHVRHRRAGRGRPSAGRP